HATPDAERICRAASSSLSSRGCRYPATASRTSRKVWRAARSTSRISWIERAGSCSTRRPASSLLSVIMDRVCPRRSWRSRDRRCRSSITARWANSSRAACSSLIAPDRRAAPIISTPIPRTSSMSGMICSQSTRAHTDPEREECEDHDSYERAAHRERYPCYGADPDEEPEKGTAIEQAEREHEGHQDAEQDERCGGPRAFARSTACRVRPHEPGVADREAQQGSKS